MKVLLIQPPMEDFYETPIRRQPLGLAYLAASLRERGHEVEILDCRTDRKERIPTPPELSYLEGFYPFDDESPFKLYSGYYHFGLGWDEIRKTIETSSAQVFGISSSFTSYHPEALRIAQMIKEGSERGVVVMGGAHVSCDPEGVLASPWVDYIVVGEGEERLPLLLDGIEKGARPKRMEIEGIGYRDGGRIILHPLSRFIDPLDRLPFPARELLDLDRYRLRRKRLAMVLTSRGCPHRCAYCSSHLILGPSFRTRSSENVLQEMKDCRDRLGIEGFDFEDDNLTFDRARAKKLLQGIVETFGERNLELFAMNGISFASLDRELMDLMKRAGFRTLNLSLVSADSPLQKKMGRPADVRAFDEILRIGEQIGLQVIAYGIFGLPDQTIEGMVETLLYLTSRRVLIGPSIYYPTPGTTLFTFCRERGILPPNLIQWRSSAFPIETEAFDRQDLATLFRLTRVINFVKGRIDLGYIPEGIRWGDLAKSVKKQRGTFLLDPLPPRGDGAWPVLLSCLLEERYFPGLRKRGKGECQVFRIPSSRKVLDLFFERGWERPILGSGMKRRES